jgi:hypothetical protein
MDKKEITYIFNCILTNEPISFSEKILPLISEYLTDIKYEYSEKLISLISSNPLLVEKVIPKIIDFYTKKYGINKLTYNNKILGFYE